MRRISDLYSMRKRTNREFWLLDISTFETPKEAANTLMKNIPNLDLDDDFYLFEKREDEMFIHEYYAIDSKSPRILQPYGTWSAKFGLQVENAVKWSRRSDFKVRKATETVTSVLKSKDFF